MIKISQREARRLRKRVQELETKQKLQFQRWGTDFPGVPIANGELIPVNAAAIRTARKLSCAVVVVVDGQCNATFYAARWS